MKICPACRKKQETAVPASNLAELEYCSACKVVWLDFGQQRPHLYARLEAQVRHWEDSLARRQA
ncbi:MAG: hypothetical protein ACAI44_13825 [Candidatus Sericytochromatia bacterium]